ncbi:MAG: AAA family ATPase [Trueperaceae bacterium]|nr:AAA family ATPase [Trueperaceae bacterium]
MARSISGDTLAMKLSESLAARLPLHTPRDVRLPRVPDKALAVIGVRRGGKTSFLERHIADRLAAGDPPGTHLLVPLEDERHVGMTAEDLGWLLERHKRVVASVREAGRRTVYLDEIQVVPGWESLVRRVLDAHDRLPLLTSYVDLMLLRDVIERHRVTNVEALRRLQRHLLANPAGSFSVSKFHRDLRSQGLPVAEETLHQMLHHLETAVLIELERRGYAAVWVRVGDDLEVDFLAEHQVADDLVVQVSLDTESDATWEREIRSLQAAAEAYPNARPLLLTLDPTPPSRPLPTWLEWMPASRWLLGKG